MKGERRYTGSTNNLPTAARLATGSAEGLLGLSANSDRLLRRPAVLPIGRLVGACGGDSPRIAAVWVAPGNAVPRGSRVKGLHRSALGFPPVCSIHTITNSAANEATQDGPSSN